ncbi:Rrf2 family transcriptional regulator [Arenicella chitinivorans]|uniref:Rrf2 family transcriptional regulator n=2 Tax=Arenicella chitinivorans TaxID=1329800 RepID=A0A918S1Z0_9GAMM|nr:Rrf2 family transcriptional regulator [Arenicella chitinivorans]
MLVLAAAPEKRELAASDIAAFHDLSANTLAKVLKQLRAAGVIAGSPGRTGGYALAKRADNITVLDVVKALDGVEPIFYCREIRRSGPCAAKSGYSSRCAIARTMDKATNAWREALSKVTMADLLDQVGDETPMSTRTKSANWLDTHSR